MSKIKSLEELIRQSTLNQMKALEYILKQYPHYFNIGQLKNIARIGRSTETWEKYNIIKKFGRDYYNNRLRQRYIVTVSQEEVDKNLKFLNKLIPEFEEWIKNYYPE